MDYTTVTEVPGHRITQEALAMAWTRYAMAGDLSAERQVLEVGCGAGQGLGVLAKRAGFVVGGDYTEGLLRAARLHYGGRIPLVRTGMRISYRFGEEHSMSRSSTRRFIIWLTQKCFSESVGGCSAGVASWLSAR